MYLEVKYVEHLASSWNDEVGARVTRKAFSASKVYNDALSEIVNYLSSIKLPEEDSFKYNPIRDKIDKLWL